MTDTPDRERGPLAGSPLAELLAALPGPTEELAQASQSAWCAQGLWLADAEMIPAQGGDAEGVEARRSLLGTQTLRALQVYREAGEPAIATDRQNGDRQATWWLDDCAVRVSVTDLASLGEAPNVNVGVYGKIANPLAFAATLQAAAELAAQWQAEREAEKEAQADAG